MGLPPTGLEWDEGSSPMSSLGDFNQDAEGTEQPSKRRRLLKKTFEINAGSAVLLAGGPSSARIVGLSLPLTIRRTTHLRRPQACCGCQVSE